MKAEVKDCVVKELFEVKQILKMASVCMKRYNWNIDNKCFCYECLAKSNTGGNSEDIIHKEDCSVLTAKAIIARFSGTTISEDETR